MLLKQYSNGNPSSSQVKLEHWYAVKEDTLKYLSTEDRSIFFPIFLLMYVVSFFANICAIYVTLKRNHRLIQKTLIISLSLSDLITATAYTINYLETFSHPLINWTLGDFMCTFIPAVQTFGVTASSATLVAIALDRYRNVIHVLNKKWNPSLWSCILGVMIAWALCAGVGYPMFTLFDNKRLYVFVELKNNTSFKEMYLCVSDKKEELKIYYICVTSIIFFPLFLIFIWLYYNVAKLIWTHRKPLQTRHNKEISATETSIVKSNEEMSKTSVQMGKIKPKNPLKRTKSIHVERKIRTFKIIIALMVIFILCRLPYHIMNIHKTVNAYNYHGYWIMIYVFNGLGLLNCALNPFLYTFLYPTINFISKVQKTINDFMCKVCCCCFSNTEFEEFEKENPFIVEKYEHKPHLNSPQLNKRNSKVKFEECTSDLTKNKMLVDNYKEVKKF